MSGGKEAQRGKWERLRAHRKLGQYPRQHLAVRIPTLPSLPHRFYSIKSDLFHMSLRAFARSRYSIPVDFIRETLSSCSEPGLQLRELLNLQTSSPLGPSVEGLHCLRGFLGEPGCWRLAYPCSSSLSSRKILKTTFQACFLIYLGHPAPGHLTSRYKGF